MSKDVTATDGASIASVASDGATEAGARVASVAPHGAAEVGRASLAAEAASDGAGTTLAQPPSDLEAEIAPSLPAHSAGGGGIGLHEVPAYVASEDSAPLLADADGDRIIALLAELGGPAEAAGAKLVADVAFGLALADVLVADGEGGAGSEFIGLDDGAGAASSGGGVEGAHLAEIPTGTLDGAMPIEMPAIKIIFDDDESTSGSLI